MKRKPESDEEEYEPEGRGRSARKREVQTFDVMALELLELSDDRCKGLPVSEKLKEGLLEARNTRSKAARRRYIRHLASLLRDSEAEVLAIRGFLAGGAYTPVRGDESYRDLERLREGLSRADSFETSLEEACAALPHIDIALVTRLAKALNGGEDEKSHRALFRELRRAADESGKDSEE